MSSIVITHHLQQHLTWQTCMRLVIPHGAATAAAAAAALPFPVCAAVVAAIVAVVAAAATAAAALRRQLPAVLQAGGFDWVAVTSPEAAAVFVEGWKAAAQPPVSFRDIG